MFSRAKKWDAPKLVEHDFYYSAEVVLHISGNWSKSCIISNRRVGKICSLLFFPAYN